MENNKSFEVQNQVRENVLKFQEEMLSIKQFEMEMKQKEKEKILNNNLTGKDESTPIRSDVLNFQKYAKANESLNKEAENNSEKTTEKKEKAVHDVKERKRIANEFKEKGNGFVKSKNYESAIKMYTHAISIHPDAVYYSNRSQCYLSLERYTECIEDATNAIKLDANSSKSYYRRMLAYEKLEEDMRALQNCQEWMSALPDDQLAKTNYDRIHNKLIETAKMKEKGKIKWSRSLESTNFIEKPLHARSTRSLRKVDVRLKRSDSPIPDYIIDKIFNNNTGEHTPEVETDSKLFKPNFLECNYTKPTPNIVENKNIVNEMNEIVKANDKKDKIPSLDEIEALKNNLITIPLTGPQFYAAWKELSDEQRFLYLKNIAESDVKIGKLLGAQLNSEMLSEIINVVHKYFISYNLPYIRMIYDLSKNSELSVLSMFLEKDDKDKLQEMLKILKTDNDTIQQIKQNFQI